MENDQDESGVDTDKVNISALLESKNIAKDLDDEDLLEIGEECKEGFELDLESRKEWEDACDDWLKLAKQAVDHKSYPWMALLTSNILCSLPQLCSLLLVLIPLLCPPMAKL